MLVEKRSGFSERLFEFAYNAEFARVHSAVLAGLPWIPSQQQEKLLAYDVRFRLKGVNAVRSLFLQHKVASFFEPMPKSYKSKSKFVGALAPEFFKFKLDNDQYNKIVNLRLRDVAVYYCSPMFIGVRRLNRHFAAGTVDGNSIWIDVRACPKLVGASKKTTHHLGYTSAMLVRRFSDGPFKAIGSEASASRISNMEAISFDMEGMRQVLTNLYGACEGEDRRSLLRRSQPGRGADLSHLLARIGSFAAQEFGLSWHLLPVEKVAE